VEDGVFSQSDFDSSKTPPENRLFKYLEIMFKDNLNKLGNKINRKKLKIILRVEGKEKEIFTGEKPEFTLVLEIIRPDAIKMAQPEEVFRYLENERFRKFLYEQSPRKFRFKLYNGEIREGRIDFSRTNLRISDNVLIYLEGENEGFHIDDLAEIAMLKSNQAGNGIHEAA
jgi:hypothetical protein